MQFLGGLKLADQGITTEPRGPTETQSTPADLFAAGAVSGRSAALDVCVAPPDAAAARGDAGQAAFDRKRTYCRQEIPDLRNPGIHHRPAATATRCRQNHSSTDGNTKLKWPSFAGEQP